MPPLMIKTRKKKMNFGTSLRNVGKDSKAKGNSLAQRMNARVGKDSNSEIFGSRGESERNDNGKRLR